MLALTREPNPIIDTVILSFADLTPDELVALKRGPPLKIVVAGVHGNKVRLAFDAPRCVRIDRLETWQSIQRDGLRPRATGNTVRQVSPVSPVSPVSSMTAHPAVD